MNSNNRYLYFRGTEWVSQALTHEPLGANGELSTSEMLYFISGGRYNPSIEDIIDEFMVSVSGRKKVEKAIEGDFYRWGIEHNVYPNALLKGITSPVSGNVGINFSTFTFCVDRPLFKNKDIVKTNSEHQIYITSNAIPVGSGSGYNYEGHLITTNPNDYLPPSDYDGIKSRVVKIATAYEAGSYGDSYWYKAGMSKYQVPLQRFRKSLKIEGDSMTRERFKCAFDRIEKKGIWWHEEMEKAVRQFDLEINMALLFQKTSVLPDGTCTLHADGKPVYTFDGIYEQVAKANFYSVPKFTLDALEDLLQTISTVTHDAGVYNMRILALCGYSAFRKIQKALGQELNLIPSIFASDLFVRKSEWHGSKKYGIIPKHNIEIGWTVVKVNIHGTDLFITHCPYFDSNILNPDINVDTGFPEKSNEILLLNVSDFDDDIPNIVMLNREGNGVSRKTRISYTDGMHSFINKGTKITGAASSFDGAEMHMLAHRGVAVHYPHTCGVLQIQEPVI